MKKIWMTLLVLTLAAALIGCSSNNDKDSKNSNKENTTNVENNGDNKAKDQDKDESKNKEDKGDKIKGDVHTTDDGKAEITLPTDWKAASQRQNALSTFEAQNMKKQKYMMMMSESKKDIGTEMDLDAYTDLIATQMSSVAVGGEQSDVESLTIDGHPAAQFTLTGDVQGTEIGYLVTIINTDRDFHQVVSWSFEENLDSYADEFKQIANSFVALDYDENASASDDDYTMETVEKNGIIMDIPSNWQENEFLSEDADLQYQSKNGYLIVLKEAKSDFGDGFALEDYFGLIEGNFEGLEPSNEEEVSINGTKGYKFDLKGSVEGINLGYVVAVLEGKDHFYQVLTWTMDSAFANQKPLFDEMINSFQEAN